MIEFKRVDLIRHMILAFFTMGLYNFWWVYKAWMYFQEKDKSDINPALRTIFSTFFLIPLFYKTEKGMVHNRVLRSMVSILLFAGILIFSLLAYLPSPESYMSVLSIFFFIQPVIAFNNMLDTDEVVMVIEQSTFNWKQIILLVVGGLFWGLITLTVVVRMLGLI